MASRDDDLIDAIVFYAGVVLLESGGRGIFDTVWLEGLGSARIMEGR